jgi:DNA-binding response OmpR family regulator
VLEVMTPGLIMLDVMMPEVDGLTLLRQLSEEPRFLSVPIVMASAKAQAADRWSAWEKGASAYLAKPFTFDEVTSLVEYLLTPPDSAEVPAEFAQPTALM